MKGNPHIVELIDVYEDDSNLSLVLELYPFFLPFPSFSPLSLSISPASGALSAFPASHLSV